MSSYMQLRYRFVAIVAVAVTARTYSVYSHGATTPFVQAAGFLHATQLVREGPTRVKEGLASPKGIPRSGVIFLASTTGPEPFSLLVQTLLLHFTGGARASSVASTKQQDASSTLPPLDLGARPLQHVIDTTPHSLSTKHTS